MEFTLLLLFFPSIYEITNDQGIEFVEHAVYVNHSGGKPYNHPGVIWKIYSNGDLFIRSPSGFKQFKLKTVDSKRIFKCVKKINKTKLRDIGSGIDLSRLLFLVKAHLPLIHIMDHLLLFALSIKAVKK